MSQGELSRFLFALVVPVLDDLVALVYSCAIRRSQTGVHRIHEARDRLGGVRLNQIVRRKNPEWNGLLYGVHVDVDYGGVGPRLPLAGNIRHVLVYGQDNVGVLQVWLSPASGVHRMVGGKVHEHRV